MVRAGLVLSLALLTGLLAEQRADVQAADTDHAATDWWQFRGPNRDGISPDKGLLSEWPKEGPKLLWKTPGLGTGFSSVSLACLRNGICQKLLKPLPGLTATVAEFTTGSAPRPQPAAKKSPAGTSTEGVASPSQ